MEGEGDGRARCGGAGLVAWLEQGASHPKAQGSSRRRDLRYGGRHGKEAGEAVART